MPRMIFVNLPVDDLAKSIGFFTDLGFTFNAQFTDENATCMVVGEQAFVMLLVRPFFASFTDKEVAGPTVTECSVGLSADTRGEVDGLVDRALELGATPAGETQDHGFMYGRSFHDLDGHLWELIWMDPAVTAPPPDC
ncbi:MAG TPA: VOC family protein [Nocardioides sp.]|uniref:VOC family protein n=1 Tax=Nocardioides sp. TaxID=35761 RepID=UPI002D7F986E|nr:VOC family protein [Nocardioides sp.]HET6652020.1 VOC family protein [Nocardioides sp.]